MDPCIRNLCDKSCEFLFTNWLCPTYANQKMRKCPPGTCSANASNVFFWNVSPGVSRKSISRKVSFSGKSNFPGDQLSQGRKFPNNDIQIYVNFDTKKSMISKCPQNLIPMKSRNSISREETSTGKSTFPGSHISREANFLKKENFPGSQLSREVNFPGKSNKFPGKSTFPGS